MTVDIVTRSEWGARRARGRLSMPTPSKRLWLHHSASEWHGRDGVRQTQAFHMDSRNYADIAYSFLVDNDGTIYEGRGAGIVGAHTEGDNDESHAICALGDFTKRRPEPAMVAAIIDLVVSGHLDGWWPNQITGGHRDAPGASTACPGGFLWNAIPALNDAIKARLLGAPTAPQEDLTIVDADTKKYLDERFDELKNALAGYATVGGERADGAAGHPDKKLSWLGEIGKKLGLKR